MTLNRHPISSVALLIFAWTFPAANNAEQALDQVVWPLPQSMKAGDGVVTIDASKFSFSASPSSADLSAAFERYQRILFPHGISSTGTAMSVVVTINAPNVPLDLGVNESYMLNIPSSGPATIQAETTWGALRALETLSQLISFDFDSETYVLRGTPIEISDYPRFAHRGLLMDTGRHFDSIRSIERLIDSMVYAKFNVLHLHLTEDQSFPMPSRIHKELPKQGAFSDQERYTWSEMEQLVEYARLRGIRVMPEFDMPGHSSSWRNSHPELFATACLDAASRGAFDPALNGTFDFIESMLNDWETGLFRDSLLHLGSDEVPDDCWKNDRDAAFMKQMGFNSSKDLFNYFVNRVAAIATKLNRSPVFWDEAFISAKPPQNAIIQNWHDASLFKEILNAGYRGIYATNGGYKNGWYLDGLAATWENMYALDPQTDIDDAQAHLILGGEGCMWGETVDPSDLELTIWPRAAAIAERLWSARSVVDVTAAKSRLLNFRCRLLSRGVDAGVVGGAGRDVPNGPGSCSQVHPPPPSANSTAPVNIII